MYSTQASEEPQQDLYQANVQTSGLLPGLATYFWTQSMYVLAAFTNIAHSITK